MSLIKLTADNIDSLYQLRLQRRLDEKASKQNKTITYEQLKNKLQQNTDKFISENEQNKRNNEELGKLDFINNYQLEPICYSDDDDDNEEDLHITNQEIDDSFHPNTARNLNQNSIEIDSDANSDDNENINQLEDDFDEYQNAIEQEISEVNNCNAFSHGGDAPTPSRPSSGILRSMVKSRPQTASNLVSKAVVSSRPNSSVFPLSMSNKNNKNKNQQTKDQLIEACTLGKGKYSTVIKAKHQVINTCVAVKVIPTNSLTNGKLRLQLAHNEAILLSRLRHQNIARLYQSFRIEWEPVTNGAAALIVLELAREGTVRSLVKEYFDENQRNSQETGLNFDFCQNLIAQLVSAVIHINDRNIIHRNITPDNILLSRVPRELMSNSASNTSFFENGHSNIQNYHYLIKLIGFDTAILAKSKQFLPPLALNNFNSPPEVLDNHFNQNPNNDTHHKIDVWSIGCIAYYLLTGKEPQFDKNTGNGSLQGSSRILLAKLLNFGIITKPAIEMIEMCLITNQDDRAQICELENCQFIQESYYKPPKRNISSATKKHFLEILGAHLNISAKSLSKRCHEQRFDELSAMYNLLLDAFGQQVSNQIDRQNEERLDLELIKKNFSERTKRAKTANAKLMRTNSKESRESDKDSIKVNLEKQGRPASHYARRLYSCRNETGENEEEGTNKKENVSQEILYNEASYHNGFGLRRPKTTAGRFIRSPASGPNKLTSNRQANSAERSSPIKKQSIPITSQTLYHSEQISAENSINAVSFRYLQAGSENIISNVNINSNNGDQMINNYNNQNRHRAQSAQNISSKSEKILRIPSKLNFDISTLKISSKAIKPANTGNVVSSIKQKNVCQSESSMFRKTKRNDYKPSPYHKSINRVDNCKPSKNSNSMRCQSMLSYKSLQMFENQNQKSVKKQNQTVNNSNLNLSRKNSLEIGESIQGTIDKSRKHTKSSRKKITQPINPKNYMLTIKTEAKTLSNQVNNNATSNNSTTNRIIGNNSNPISRNFNSRTPGL